MLPIYLSKKADREPLPLASGPIVCLRGVETSLIKVRPESAYFAYITSRAYFVAGAPSKNCQFRIYVAGVLMSFYDQNRNTALGQIGQPKEEASPIRVPDGADVEVRFFNADAVDYQDVECDGLIEYFRARL